MALSNTQKNFRYALEIDGINMFLLQEVTPPSVESPILEHGAPGNLPNGKSPDKVKIGDLVLKKLRPATGGDTWAWDWFAENITGLSTDFNKIGFLVELAPDGFTSARKWFLGNMFVTKIEGETYKAQGGDNIMETVTVAVENYIPQDSPLWVRLFGGAGLQAAGFSGTLGNS